MQRGNFLEIINAFAILIEHLEKDAKNAVLIEHLEESAKNGKMVSWQIENDIFECLFEFVRSKIKDEIPDY